ncbi:MAG: penicillin-binding protein 2 [Verrucomicrobiales bacterium]|nr:penicillin-binding protein 2 [Verrucomicrobiales bacterium]
MEKNQQSRIISVCVFLLLLLGSLSVRLIWIQVNRGADLAESARAHYEYEQVLEAPRGRIFDRNGELLATSQIVYDLVVDCVHLRDPGLAKVGLAKKESGKPGALRHSYDPGELQIRYMDYVVEVISGVTRISEADLARKLKSSEKGELVLARNIEEDYRKELQQMLSDAAIGGIYLRKTHRRTYPSPLSLTHVIGYVGADQKGKEGVERVFDAEMTGIDGYKVCERDRRRREILAYRKASIAPIPGRDVYLTIDMALQAEVETQVSKLMTMYRPEKISTIWLHPQTGEVLALANRPHFDLETRVGERRNIAVADVYQPGSTFKIVGFGAAFDQKLVKPDTMIDCHNGEYDEEGFVMKDHAPFGKLTAEMVLAKSSNIGSYMVAKPLGEKAFHRYMELFGFGTKTGIALTAESAGAIFPVDQWTRPSFSSKVIGYEVMVTPLQMAAACGVVANRGLYKSPVLVKGITDSDISGLRKSAINRERRVISEQAARDLKNCMVSALRIGTARRASIPGYTVAGKTGTARKHVENVGYVDGRYVVSFVGFLPADNPQLLGIVVIDDPKSKDLDLYGGTIAAPAFKSIAQEAVKILGIKPDVPDELTSLRDKSNLAVAREE